MTNSTNQAAWQEDYQQKQQEIERQKRAYYDAVENLILLRHTRYYYDYLCSQYNSYPMEMKLRDLGFLVTHGFDLQQSVRDYKADREEYITEAISTTFVCYIVYMRYGECQHITNQILNKLLEEQLIQLFIDEVRLRYDEQNHTVELLGWNDEELVKMAEGDKDRFFWLVTTAKLRFESLKSLRV